MKKVVKKKARSLLRVIFGRTTIVVALVLLQFAILFATFQIFSVYMGYLYSGFTIIGTIVTIYIINQDINPSFKLSWIMPIIVFPVIGSLFYIYFKLEIGTWAISKKLKILIGAQEELLKQDEEVYNNLAKSDHGEARLATYMNNYGKFPVYEGCEAKYFTSGEEKFEELKIQLEQAKEFIFMEYFILEEGLMWNSVLEILKRKVEEGVEVRVMYDGTCAIALLPYSYPKTLRKYGIKAKMFSPIRPILSSAQNNRDHRKILVIDGHTAFTGGINLADEYINEYERFGHWKDTAIMIKGEAVKSFTMMFLHMWNVEEKEIESNEKYVRTNICVDRPKEELGFVMPYGDSPLDDETVGELVYMDVINRAEHYVHITTPYLILDNEMLVALKFAAKRGIEVKIIMPHIPDKTYAYNLARTYYAELIIAGVEIWEYTPGFIHAKSFVSDDVRGVVGSINLDYRSLYLHFECAAYVYANPVVHDIETDFQKTLEKSMRITLEDCKKYNIFKKVYGRALRLLAPLM